MRIVAWNIRAGGGARIDSIADHLRRWRPDIAVLSEFRGTAPSTTLATGLAAHGLIHQRSTVSRAHPPANALLVASRFRLRALPCRGAPDHPCRWLGVRVMAPRPLDLGAVHVPNRVSGMKYPFLDALTAVARRWRRRHAVIIGDTNTGWPDIDEQSGVFNTYERAFLDSLIALGWHDAFRTLHGQRRAYSWYSPNGDNGFRLDQGFVSAGVVRGLGFCGYRWAGGRRSGVSDHAALILDLDARGVQRD